MNRNKLIALSLKYQGEYFDILKHLDENIEIIDYKENVLTIFDKEYPKALFDLKYPPLVLYYKGSLDLLNNEIYGVVGSRNACEYALEATKSLVENYEDITIVSGLAKGIDAIAHRYAKKTIGILGSGINYIYPKCNYDLIQNVAINGLILSEYPDDTKPLAFHFPFRNRIIAALSKRIYIMQSSIRSGTMTTINEGLELGKEIRVLPYDIFSEYGKQNNHLINEGALLIEREEIAF